MPDVLDRRSLLLAGLGGVLLTGCSGVSSGDAGFVSGSGALTRVEPAKRVPAPVLSGPTIEGGRFDAASAAGRVLVYNVWGSWCAPCRKEAPALARAARSTSGRAAFVGINTRDNDARTAQAFARSFGLPYPSLYDPQGRLLLGFGSLPPSAIPTTIVVDASGRVAARLLGEATEATLVGLVDDVAGGR